MIETEFSQFIDGFNRLAKLDLDLGEAADPMAAVAKLNAYRAQVLAGPEIRTSATHQIALLTFVNIAARFALGGVTVAGIEGAPMLTPWPGERLENAVEMLGGRLGAIELGSPAVLVGGDDGRVQYDCRMTFSGWRGGIVPRGSLCLDERTAIPPAAVLAGALAAAETFALLRGEPGAGRRCLGLSLWQPDADRDWLSGASDGPALAALPDHLWVLGLGHIGQAFLWTLAMCPYQDRAGVQLVLQDVDSVTGSTASTSILTAPGTKGAKTRTVAARMEGLGFATRLVERPFDGRFTHRPDDPAILVCGVDNALARAQLEEPGFKFVVEAGLGRTAADFRSMRLHTFPSQRHARDLWRAGSSAIDHLIGAAPGYRRLRESGVDDCGIARLAGTAVGAPFVGCVAATLMLGQILKLLHQGPIDAVVDLDLRVMNARRAVGNKVELLLNPGFQSCVSSPT